MAINRTFTAADYAVFAVMLVVSAAIGLFYAYRGRKQNQNTLGYLLANRSMTMIPVAISLSMSFQSSLTILAIPAEVYLYGTMIWWVLVIYILIAIITSEIFLPTFYRLGISSTYEGGHFRIPFFRILVSMPVSITSITSTRFVYSLINKASQTDIADFISECYKLYLELRFGKISRFCGMIIFTVASTFYCGIVIYGPALAFEAVTGFPLWAAIVSTGVVCTIYTAVGGLKGVIWTDVFQGFVMIAGLLAFLIKGSADVGGYSEVWRAAERGRRIDFVQSIYLNVIGLVLLFTLGVLSGLTMYAYYETCDPFRSKCVGRPDQLLPYMMLDIFEQYPGVSGLILSAVYAGSLSSVSSAVNAMATVTMEDVVKPAVGKKCTDSTYSRISKVVVLGFGFVSIGMAFLLSTTTELLQAAFSLMGMLMGSLVGLFTLAIHFPFSNEIGGVSGLIAGIVCTVWLYIGRQSIKKSNALIRRLPLRIDSCYSTCQSLTTSHLLNDSTVSLWNSSSTVDPYSGSSSGIFTPTATSINLLDESTAAMQPSMNSGDNVPYYNISYHYISVIGLCGTLAVGIIVSLATGGWKARNDVDKRLLRPPFDHWIFRSCLPEKVRWFLRFGIDWEDNDNEKDIRLASIATNSQKSGHASLKETDGEEKGIEANSFQPDEESTHI